MQYAGSDIGRNLASGNGGVRLLGSHSSRVPMARRPSEDPPIDDSPGHHLPPLAVSVPDIGIEIIDPEGSGGPAGPRCADDDQRERLAKTLQELIATKFPDADVRTACVPLQAGGSANAIGIWTRPVLNGADHEARNRGIAQLDLISGSELVAILLNATFIRRFARELFAGEAHRLTPDGVPNPNGPIHLGDLDVVFDASLNAVRTVIPGFDERPWPDVSFTLTLLDQYPRARPPDEPDIICDSATELDTDVGWIEFLTFAASLASLFNPWFLPAFALFGYEVIKVATTEPPAETGVGRGVLNLLPPDVPLEKGDKLAFTYRQPEVGAGGLLVRGSYLQVPRAPSAEIFGIRRLAADATTGTASGDFRAVADDLRAPLAFTWGGDGEPLVQGGESTVISFSTGGAPAGSVVKRQVTVHIVDADGLHADAGATVEIHVSDMNDDTVPAVCRTKPWLCDDDE
jgi:hypothetical protein